MLSLLLVSTVSAASFPVVVRFKGADANLAAPIEVVMTAGEVSARCTMVDDGADPDVAAGDGTMTCAAPIDGPAVTFKLMAGGGGKVLGTETISFVIDRAPRFALLTLDGGNLTAIATTPSGAAPLTPGVGPGNNPIGMGVPSDRPPDASLPPTAADPVSVALPGGGVGMVDPNGPGPSGSPAPLAEPEPQGGAPTTFPPGMPGAPGAEGGPTPAPQGAPGQLPTPTTDDGGVGFLLVSISAVMLAAFGVALWAFWPRARRRADTQLARIPEPGLLDGALPPLSEGPVVWSLAPGAESVLGPLLTLLADQHRVVVHAPEGVVIPPVLGGPVFAVKDLRPAKLAAQVGPLADEPGAPVVLLVVAGADAEAIRASWPAGVGGILFGGAGGDVQAAVDGDGWQLSHRGATTRVRAGERGLVVQK